MDINQFIENFTAQLENEEGATITAATEFRKLEEWDSLVALSVIAMVDEKYAAKLTGDDIRDSNTVKDLYQKVSAKVAS
jgi:acyl carrier protein